MDGIGFDPITMSGSPPAPNDMLADGNVPVWNGTPPTCSALRRAGPAGVPPTGKIIPKKTCPGYELATVCTCHFAARNILSICIARKVASGSPLTKAIEMLPGDIVRDCVIAYRSPRKFTLEFKARNLLAGKIYF